MIREIHDASQWNSFLLNLSPNTFLQSWEWGQVQKESGEGVRYLGVFEGNQQIGACLTLTVHARRGAHFLVPHGPIFASEELARTYLPEIIAYLQSNARPLSSARQAATAERMMALRIAPLLRTTPENQSVFRQLHFRHAPMHVHAELTWMLDISKPEPELLAGMRKTTRHAIQKSQQAGVTVEVTTDEKALARFMPLYEQTKHRHDFVPYSSKLIQSQFRNFTQSSSPNVGAYLALAKHQNQDIAAGIFFQFGATVFYYHGASVKTSSRISPAQLLQWESIRAARRRGAKHYNFWGISRDDQPTHPFSGITTFKRGFGGYAIDYLHAQDLPLATGYWKLWLVEHLRRLKRGF